MEKAMPENPMIEKTVLERAVMEQTMLKDHVGEPLDGEDQLESPMMQKT